MLKGIPLDVGHGRCMILSMNYSPISDDSETGSFRIEKKHSCLKTTKLEEVMKSERKLIELNHHLRRTVCFLLRRRLSIQNFNHHSKTNDMTIAGRNSMIWMSQGYFLLKNSVDVPASHSLVNSGNSGNFFRRFGWLPLSRWTPQEILEIWLLDFGGGSVSPWRTHMIVWTYIYIHQDQDVFGPCLPWWVFRVVGRERRNCEEIGCLRRPTKRMR